MSGNALARSMKMPRAQWKAGKTFALSTCVTFAPGRPRSAARRKQKS